MGLRRVLSSFSGDPRGVAKYLQFVANPGASKEDPVFVVGPPRSGTTLLYTRIVSYDGFCGPTNETGFFMRTNPYRIDMDPLPKDVWRKLVDESGTQAERLDKAIEWFKDKYGGRFVEKTPQHCLSYRRMLAVWPDCEIVAIVRHPMDCVASALRNRDFIPQGHSIERSARYWRKCATAIYHMRSDRRCKVLRYEDLVASSEQLADIIELLSRDSSYGSNKKEIRHAFIGKKGFELLGSPITSGRVGIWKEELTGVQAERIWRIAGNVASHFGYDSTPSSPRSVPV